jgi:hypothetical protein
VKSIITRDVTIAESDAAGGTVPAVALDRNLGHRRCGNGDAF